MIPNLSIQSKVLIGGIELNLPDPGGIFGNGAVFGLGIIFQILFGLTTFVFVLFTIIGALRILKSQGDPEQIQSGVKKIKFIWIGSAATLIFFVIVSLVGSIMGFGTPADWGATLAQCGGISGPFYFAQVDAQTEYYKRINLIVPSSNVAYCCKYTASKNTSTSKELFYEKNASQWGFDTKKDSYVWVIDWYSGNLPPPSRFGVSECVMRGK